MSFLPAGYSVPWALMMAAAPSLSKRGARGFNRDGAPFSCHHDAMIQVTPAILLDDAAIEEHFIRAGGPGGQNVNKVATAVQLRFRIDGVALDDGTKRRLRTLAGKRLTKDDVIVITAERHRTRERNRADALERLVDLVRRAAIRPKTRRATKPGRAQREARLEVKARRSQVKRLRRHRPAED
jgi:ribosome-associated protein